jgi:hypothetical protein
MLEMNRTRAASRDRQPKLTRLAWLLALAIASLSSVGPAQDFSAVLSGHAILQAHTPLDPPSDAPESLRLAGKYTAPGHRRMDEPGVFPGTSHRSHRDAPRPTGMSLPLAKQAIQGFSGAKRLSDGSFLVVSDNGFGTKANSPDAMLMFHRLCPDWRNGTVRVLQTVFLSDPKRVLPFLIVNEGTSRRYLTGGDLDIESIQPIGDAIYLGDEFGPYLVRVDWSGQVTGFWETVQGTSTVKSPDHFGSGRPEASDLHVPRSKGFEAMAASLDGRFLYPMFEGVLLEDQPSSTDSRKRAAVRILEFEIERSRFTGKWWRYELESPTNSISDFNLITAETGLVIERDDGEGDLSLACAGSPRPDCFNEPARFKRVFKIGLSGGNDVDGPVRKLGSIDLLAIADPGHRARAGRRGATFTFPFYTIESVAIVDADHILVANDNNLGFSSGRQIGRNDDSELILLYVPELLRAR